MSSKRKVPIHLNLSGVIYILCGRFDMNEKYNKFFPMLILTAGNLFVFLIVFLLTWFSSEITELITPFLMIFVLLIQVLLVVGIFITNIVMTIALLTTKKANISIILPVIVCPILTMGLLSFPYGTAKVNLEHFLFEDARLKIVEDYKNGQPLDIPFYVSVGGTVVAKKLENDEVIVGFWVYRGMASSFSLVYYTSVDSVDAIGYGTFSSDTDILSTRKIAPHWYYMSFD